MDGLRVKKWSAEIKGFMEVQNILVDTLKY